MGSVYHLIKDYSHFVQTPTDWSKVQHYEIAIVTGAIAIMAYLVILFCDHRRQKEILENPLITIKPID